MASSAGSGDCGSGWAQAPTRRSRNDQVATDVAMFVRVHADRDRRAMLDVLDVTMIGTPPLRQRHLTGRCRLTHLQREQAG